jgi:hypothetical protein
MSDLRDIQKQAEEQAKKGKLPEKQERPSGEAGGLPNADLNLLNVHGSKQQTKASDTPPKVEPKKAAEQKPEKKEEPGSLLSWSGAWGTVKGGFKTLASLPADTFNAVVNPDHGKVYRGIATGDSVRLADNVGFTASVKRTGSDVYTGVSYLATHPIEAYNRTSERYNKASSEQKGVMFGSTLTLTGTLFWGTGLGGKTSKLLGFAKVEEGIATGRALGEVSALSREANFARGLNTFNTEARLAREGRLAGMLDDAALTSRVLPAGRLGENTRFLNAFKEPKLGEQLTQGAKTAEALGGAKVVDLTDKAKIAEAAAADRWVLGIRNTTERLSEKLKFDLLTGQGAERAAGTEAASLAFRERALTLTREHKVIGDAVTVVLENGADSAAGRLAMRELKESLGRYSKTAGFDAKTIRDIDKVLVELEESLTISRSVRMAETGFGTTGADQLGRSVSGKEHALKENLTSIEKELSAGGKAEDAVALQRSGELKDSMRSFSQATDASTRERALAEFEMRYNRYTASLSETTLGKSGKLDLALTDRAAVEFRATAKGALEAGTTAEAAQPALLKLSNVEAVVREEQIGLKLQQARELTGGAQTAEARAILTEAERLETSLRNLRAAEKVAADTLSADSAGSRAAALAREKAAADFEGRLNAYNTLVKDSKFAKTASADLTISDHVAVEARAFGRFGREASPLLNDANATRRLDVFNGTNKGSLADSNLVAKVDDLSAAGKGSLAADSKLATKAEEAAGTAKGALAADSKLAAKAEEAAGTVKGALAADSKLAAKAEEVAGTVKGALAADSKLAAKVEEVAGTGKGTLAADSKLVAKAEEVSGINRGAAVADGHLAAKVEASTNAGRGNAAINATAAGRVEAAGNAAKGSTIADTTALGRAANVADAAALNAQRELLLKSTAKLEEAASLGDAAVRARVLEVQQGLERFSSLSANQTTGARELQEVSSALRSSIRGYNDVLDASPAARALAGKLHLEDSLASPSRIFQGDRLGNLNPAFYGDGAKLYLERSMYGGRFAVDPGSLATKVDFANSMRFTPSAVGGNWSAIAQPKLEELVNRAAHTAFRSGSMVQGIASDGFLSYLRSFIPTSTTDWVNVFKGYTILNNSYIIGTGLRDLGREINAATESATASRDGKTTDREPVQPIGHASVVGTTSGTTGRAGAVLDSLSSSRTASGSAGADPVTKRELYAERKDGSAPGQVFASQKGPALSPLVQALSTPKSETQAIARIASPVAEELKKKPSWWATVFGDDSGHRPLLKSEDTRSSEETKSPATIMPVRRIGGVEGGSQRIITPVFDPRYIRLQSELLGTFGLPRSLNGPSSMQADGDRKARVKGGTLHNDEKLAKQFPFLVSGAVVAESGVRQSNSKFSAKAEDREHKGMGKITGGAVSATATQPALGNEDGSAPAMVTQGGPQQPTSSSSSQNDED